MCVERGFEMTDYREDMEPLLSVMVKPRETFRFMIDNKKFTYALYTGAVAGVASMLITMYGTAFPVGFGLGDVVYSSIVTGILVFMLTNLVLAFVLAKVGTMLKGKGTFKEMFQTVCMANAPYFWVMPIVLFWLQNAAHTFFKFDFNIETSIRDMIWAYVGLFSVAVAAIWSVVLSIVGISEVHQFSKWKGFAVFLLGSLTVLAVNVLLLTI